MMEANFYMPRKLNGLVHIIWEQYSEQAMNWKILPSGYIELIFNIGPPMDEVQGKNVSTSFNPTERFCFMSGLHTQPLYMNFSKFHVMGVQMDPLALKAIFGIPCDELVDYAIHGELILSGISEIEDKLKQKNSFDSKAKWLEQYLLSQINEEHELHVAFKLRKLIRKICMQQGHRSATIESLTGYSHTHTHRLFTEWMGLAPAYCIRMYQYLSALNSIHHTNVPLSEIAYMHGFYDQAHFIRNFKEFTHMSPGKYRRAKTLIIGQLNQ